MIHWTHTHSLSLSLSLSVCVCVCLSTQPQDLAGRAKCKGRLSAPSPATHCLHCTHTMITGSSSRSVLLDRSSALLLYACLWCIYLSIYLSVCISVVLFIHHYTARHGMTGTSLGRRCVGTSQMGAVAQQWRWRRQLHQARGGSSHR